MVSSLPEGWKSRPLGELVSKDGISYGVVQPGATLTDGVPIVRVADISDGRVLVHDVKRIDPQVEAAYSRSRLRGGEVLLSLVGSIGEVALVPESLRGWNVARAIGVIRPDPSVGARWIATCLRSPELRHYMDVWKTTTVQETLNLRDVARLPIAVPPLDERDRILHVLGALDDTIELNRRMNQTLEALVAVAFERATESSGTQTLLELALSSRDTIDPAATPDEEFDHFSIPAYDVSRLPAREPGSAIRSTKLTVHPDTVLISKLNPRIPRVWLPWIDRERRAISSTEFLVLRPVPGVARELVYAAVRYREFLEDLASLATGTSGSHQRARGDDVLALDVRVPVDRETFLMLAKPVLERVVANQRESRTLAALRDALLPKLISGELRIHDA